MSMIKYGMKLVWWIVVGLVVLVCVDSLFGRGVLGKLILLGEMMGIVMMMYGCYLEWREEEGLDDMYMSEEWLLENKIEDEMERRLD
jgi:hypothetical protein